VKLPIALLVALATAGLMSAQGPAGRNDEPVRTVLARVPEKDRAKPNPFEKDPQALSAGKKLFDQHCAECHGESGDGSRKGPSLITAEFQQAKPGEIFWILTNGVIRHGMPAWSKLPEPQRWQIVTFLRQLALPAK
jgi:mono/diheme cytochrome c family protein